MTETTPEGPDEIEDEDFAVLDSFMPGEAARIIRRIMRKARRLGEVQEALTALNQARQAQADRIQTLEQQVAAGNQAIAALQAADLSHEGALQQLNQARQNQAQRITQLEARVTTLEGTP